VIAGTVAGVSAYIFGLPFPIVLAVITGFLDLIPQVGATVAAVILVAVALTVSTPAALAMLVIQLIYQQLENYVVYPLVYRRAVELSGFTTIVAVLIAGSILGVVGAILAVPFAAVIKTVIREAGRPRRERMAALRDAGAGAPAHAAPQAASPEAPVDAVTPPA
jgi:predicted PurR-regulated permease PerM